MSANERKQVSILAMIVGFAKKDYFGRLSNDIYSISNTGLTVYAKEQPMQQRDLDRIVKFFEYAEGYIVKQNLQRSMLLMLSILGGFVAEILPYLKNERKKAVWSELDMVVVKETSKAKDSMFDVLEDAEKIIALIGNTL